MRGLAARGTRPCLRQGSLQSSSFLAPLRRTILPRSLRKCTSADTFALLLAPVLTAAFVIDCTVKTYKITDLDRQIAAVEEAVEASRQRQLQAWERLQHRSIRLGAFTQRRMMSTTARNNSLEVDSDLDPLEREAEITRADTTDADNVDDGHVREEHVSMQARWERLNATRLALALMLEIRAGRRVAYRPAAVIDPGTHLKAHSMDYLLKELEVVTKLQRRIDIETVPWDIPMPPEFVQKKQQLGDEILDICLRYRDADLHLPDFILSFVKLIGEYKMGPPISSYIRMMRALQVTLCHSPLPLMVEDAIWNSHETLASWHIANILYRQGSDGDSSRFAEFLDRLSKQPEHPRPKTTWFRSQVNGIRIPIPKSRNPHLHTALVRAALCNQQQNVAEAHATVFFSRAQVENWDGVPKFHIITCFLQSYGHWGSWSIGQRWLQNAVVWAQDIADAGEHFLRRLILRMLDFCVACGRRDMYDHIISAAVASHFTVPEVDNTKAVKMSHRMQRIRLDWINLSKAANPYSAPMAVSMADVSRFQEHLKDKFGEQQSLPFEQKDFHPADATFEDSSDYVVHRSLNLTENLRDANTSREATHEASETKPSPNASDTASSPSGPKMGSSEHALLQRSPFFHSGGDANAASAYQPFAQTRSKILSQTDKLARPATGGNLQTAMRPRIDARAFDAQKSELERLRKELAQANDKIKQLQRQSVPTSAVDDDQELVAAHAAN